METLSKYTQIRKSLEFHRGGSLIGIKNGDHFRLDRMNARQYFSIHPKWEEKIIKYFRELSVTENKIIHLDICGRANASGLGAQKSYCFSLKASESTKKFWGEPGHIFFDGDIFNSNDFSNFISFLKEEEPPALVTFEPVAGLQNYTPGMGSSKEIPLYKAVTFQQLVKRLGQIVNIVRPGGYIYIERPFQFDIDNFMDFFNRVPANKYRISIDLKKIARRLKCRIEIHREINGIYFLLRKGEKSNAH